GGKAPGGLPWGHAYPPLRLECAHVSANHACGIRLPRPRGQALRRNRRRPGRLRPRPPLPRHGALPFPDRSPDASCRVGTGGREDRRVCPTPPVGAMPFTDLRAIVGQAVTALEAFTPDEVNSWSGKDLDIDLFRPLNEDNASTSIWAPRTLAFTSETFLLSFSLPNF